MRCFLAVPLREPTLTAMQRLLATLQPVLHGVRWVRPEALHITVHFLGSVSQVEADRAAAAVAPVVRSTRRFEVTIDRLGAFPSARRPRVLWAGGGEGADTLRRFAQRCHAELQKAEFEVEKRPFTAHCTLGRVNSWDAPNADLWSSVGRALERSTFLAETLVLYESVAHPGGAVYTPVQQLELAPA